jgi:hypothetical protein
MASRPRRWSAHCSTSRRDRPSSTGHSWQHFVSVRSTDPRYPLAGIQASITPHACSELSTVSESDMDDWWLVTLIVVAFIVAVTLLVYLGLEWAAGM